MGAIDFESMAMGINREAPGALGELWMRLRKTLSAVMMGRDIV